MERKKSGLIQQEQIYKMDLLTYSRDTQTARGILLNLIAQKKQTIYGARAINRQLPLNLRRETYDYDILTKKPKQAAEELVMKLNKEYGQEEFKVVPAKHKGTYKVKEVKTGKTIADYTGTTKKPKSKKVLGVRYANLPYQERKLKRILKDEASAFRHEKDIETLQRIKQGKAIKVF